MKEEIEPGYRYRSPAKETLERLHTGDIKFDHIEKTMTDLNLKFELMSKDISTLCEKLTEHVTQNSDDFKELKSDSKELTKKIDDFIECADKKYANKNVEVWINWALKIIVGVVILAMLSLVIIKNV